MNSQNSVPALNRLIQSLCGLATVSFGSEPLRTQDELRIDVARMTEHFQALGVSYGDRVGILAHTSYWWLVIDLACIALGAVSVPFDMTRKWSLDECVKRYQLRILLSDNPQPASDQVIPLAVLVDEASRRHPAQLAPFSFQPSDIYTVKFTSGTSDDVKAIGTCVNHFDHTTCHISQMFGLNSRDTFLMLMPMTVWLQRTFVHLCLWHNIPITFGRLERSVQLLTQVRPTVVIGVPQLLRSLQVIHRRQCASGAGGTFQEIWGGRIRCVWTGTAPVSHELLEFYEEEGVPVYEGYGMAETGMIAKNYPGHCRLGSVGPPFPDKHLQLDADGQILVRSDYHAAAAYLDENEPSGCYQSGGIVATGDIGYLDDDGFLHIQGRLSDVIVLANGRKVHPRTVEDRLRNSPLIANCCVYGQGKPWLSVVIVPAPDVYSNSELMTELARINSELESYQRLYGHIIAEPFTVENQLMTSTGKVSRLRIHARFHRELDALYVSHSGT